MGGVQFDPVKDIPDLSGKVILVTGGNSGLGEAIIKAYAPHNPATIYLAARRDPATLAPLLERLQALAPRTTITLLQLDLASLASVAAAAARVAADAPRLDILHLNGGISALPRATTTDGYELQFGTNFVGHALLAKLLAPKLLETAALPGADVRVVAVSSVAHRVFAPRAGVEFDSLATDGSALGAMALYGQSMVAKTLYMHELARRYPQVSWTSAHPGTVKTEVWNGPKFNNVLGKIGKFLASITGVSADEGAKTQLWCSVSKDVENGLYYEPVGVKDKQSGNAYNPELEKKLWEWTERELAKHSDASWPESK